MQKALKPGPWKSFKNCGDEKESSVYIKCRLTHYRMGENAVEQKILMVLLVKYIADHTRYIQVSHELKNHHKKLMQFNFS